MVPPIHVLFVLYCVYKQTLSHFFDKKDFAFFGPLTFLEIFESFPQLVIQTIIFFSFQVNRKGQQQVVFILSSLASLMGMGKVIFMYYQRYAVVKRGFVVESIDDSAYLCELIKTDDVDNDAEIYKVINRMKAQNISFQESDRNIPTIIMMSKSGREKVVDILLQLRADHTIVDVYGNTPLISASENGHDKVVDLLLQAGADYAAVNEHDGNTVLIFASRRGHVNVVDLLLQAGADHAAVHEYGNTALILADADHAAVNRRGNTALILASEKGYEKAVDLLLQIGADHAAVNEDSNTALILASENGHEKVVDLLLQAGADHAAVNKDGNKALTLASKNAHEKVVDLLLQAGADHAAVHEARANGMQTRLIICACVPCIGALPSRKDLSEPKKEKPRPQGRSEKKNQASAAEEPARHSWLLTELNLNKS